MHDVVDLAIRIQGRKQQTFVLAGMLVFTDKIIDKETANRIRREIGMTQVAQIFEEEKRQEVEKVLRREREEKRQALEALEKRVLQKEQEEKKRREKEMLRMVIRMIKKNYPAEDIVSFAPGYSEDDVEQLRKEIML